MRPRQDTYFFMKAGLSFLLLVSILFPTGAVMANPAKPTVKPTASQVNQAITLDFRGFGGGISEEAKKTSIRNILSAQKQLIINGSIVLESCKTNPKKTQETCTVSYALNKRPEPVANAGGATKNAGVTIQLAGKGMPYGSLINSSVTNVLVNVGKSATHAGFLFGIERPWVQRVVNHSTSKNIQHVAITISRGGVEFLKHSWKKIGKAFLFVGKSKIFQLLGKIVAIPFKGVGWVLGATSGIGNTGQEVNFQSALGNLFYYVIGTFLIEQGTEFIGNGLVHVGTKMSEDRTATIKRTVIILY